MPSPAACHGLRRTRAFDALVVALHGNACSKFPPSSGVEAFACVLIGVAFCFRHRDGIAAAAEVGYAVSRAMAHCETNELGDYHVVIGSGSQLFLGSPPLIRPGDTKAAIAALSSELAWTSGQA